MNGLTLLVIIILTVIIILQRKQIRELQQSVSSWRQSALMLTKERSNNG